MGMGLLPVLECHHGHGRARCPLCLFSLWPRGLKPSGPLRSALLVTPPKLLLPVRPRPPVSCLSFWRGILEAAGDTDSRSVSASVSVGSTYASLTALLLFPGRGPRQSAACCGGHTDSQARGRYNGASTSRSRVLAPSQDPQKYNGDDARDT